MSDKLKWMNRHFVLLRHKSLNDVCNIEGYKIRPDLLSFFTNKTDAEEIVWNFADAKRWKCACELMAYMAHRRAAVWWGYRCVLSLYEELEEVPAEDRDIDSIATSFEPKIPDFAKVEPPKPDMTRVNRVLGLIEESKAALNELKKAIDPKIMSEVEEAVQYGFDIFKQANGIDPIEAFKKALEFEKNPQPVDPKSPIFVASEQLEAQLQTVRKETLDTIHAVIPPKVPEHEKKISDNAMQAVYRWIVSPDEINAKKALDIGNECPDTPAGLLSLTAFWAGGNLMPDPEQDQVIPTPNGLAANGLSQVLLMCALHKGGTRKLKERYEHYFNLGVEVLTGQSNWDESVFEGEAPHETDISPVKNIEKEKDSATMAATDKKNLSSAYKRWKPEPKNQEE
ncbi:MAG: hypothetical protein J5787_05670 [Alphaproteobacteria bacterium]|nr:hypothetical protein [Alphaproteobacteria bacterium]